MLLWHVINFLRDTPGSKIGANVKYILMLLRRNLKVVKKIGTLYTQQQISGIIHKYRARIQIAMVVRKKMCKEMYFLLQ